MSDLEIYAVIAIVSFLVGAGGAVACLYDQFDIVPKQKKRDGDPDI